MTVTVNPDTKGQLRVALVAEAVSGGVAMHVADLIRGLSAGGVAAHLVVPAGERLDRSIFDDSVLDRCASIGQVPMPHRIGWRDPLAWLAVYRQLLRIRPDIVHSHSSKAGVLARCCRGPWRQVYTPHALYTLNPALSPLRRRVIGGIERLLGNHACDRLVAVSGAEASHAHEALRIARQRITTIPNGVPSFDTLPRAEARRTLGIDPDRFVVGFIGRLVYQKGLDRLIGVADLLRGRLGCPAQIAVIGQGDFAAVAGCPADAVPPNVRLVGAVAQARRYLGAFDALLLPSRYEGLPYVYLEAMQAGVPIVTTAVAGASELVDAEEIGLVVTNTDDPWPLASALARVHDDAALRERLRRNCAAAAQRHSVEAMVHRVMRLYHDLMAPRRQGTMQ
ncbi:glycosyltransferase family 4 protein [Cupriavidus agavae]|uniref:Glycosyltransferase involved in cell wall biosynthesis n=1 Tax=Cupriavidus agavae TaxID=1001822 RepID=A0A4Q7S7E4_9BURK|nr:glycosyltransferase family 4 protein [Cupriavidus agavae]RZT42331.1 glycosyltransferase involved in cell wall biosynthesis [Cupriavidus agavae]